MKTTRNEKEIRNKKGRKEKLFFLSFLRFDYLVEEDVVQKRKFEQKVIE